MVIVFLIGQFFLKRMFYYFFLVKSDEKIKIEKEEYKKRKLNKYLDNIYENVVRTFSIDIANKYCIGCKFFNSPPFVHTCLLSNIDKIDMFGKEALGVGIKSGIINHRFYDKSLKKFTVDEINAFIETSGEKKYKDVKKFFLLERI